LIALRRKRQHRLAYVDEGLGQVFWASLCPDVLSGRYFSRRLWQKCRWSARDTIAAHRPAGCSGVQETEPELRKGGGAKLQPSGHQTVGSKEALVPTSVFKHDLGRRPPAKSLTRDEAPRIAVRSSLAELVMAAAVT